MRIESPVWMWIPWCYIIIRSTASCYKEIFFHCGITIDNNQKNKVDRNQKTFQHHDRWHCERIKHAPLADVLVIFDAYARELVAGDYSCRGSLRSTWWYLLRRQSEKQDESHRCRKLLFPHSWDPLLARQQPINYQAKHPRIQGWEEHTEWWP